jgi:hypothetical protein
VVVRHPPHQTETLPYRLAATDVPTRHPQSALPRVACGELVAYARQLGLDRWRLVPTRANRMPTAASYLRRPGDTQFRAFKFDLLRIDNGAIAEITTFGAALFPAFGLPPVLPDT